MTVSFEGAALCVAIVLLVAIGSTLAVVSVIREWNRQRIKKEDKDQALLGAVQSVHEAMKVVVIRIQDKSETDNDHHSQVLTEVHELSVLVLDVEKRLTQQHSETRQAVRAHDTHGHYGATVQVSTGESAANQAGENRHERR